MSAVEFFPPLNASLNALSGILLLIAYWHIRNKRIAQHKRFMLAACTTVHHEPARDARRVGARAVGDPEVECADSEMAHGSVGG
jgi:hypothetical protein